MFDFRVFEIWFFGLQTKSNEDVQSSFYSQASKCCGFYQRWIFIISNLIIFITQKFSIRKTQSLCMQSDAIETVQNQINLSDKSQTASLQLFGNVDTQMQTMQTTLRFSLDSKIWDLSVAAARDCCDVWSCCAYRAPPSLAMSAW